MAEEEFKKRPNNEIKNSEDSLVRHSTVAKERERNFTSNNLSMHTYSMEHFESMTGSADVVKRGMKTGARPLPMKPMNRLNHTSQHDQRSVDPYNLAG